LQIGADYGLVDCSTGTPLPDFYTALMFTHVMGTTVLGIELRDSTGAKMGDGSVVRAYAHCLAPKESAATAKGGVAMLIINLSNRSTMAHFDETVGALAREYVLEASDNAAVSLTGIAGLLGTAVTLNGELLRTAADGVVPRPTPRVAINASRARLPAHSIGFFVFPKASFADCGSQ
jgi:hypothetical protein